jgi:hypothetical protein
MTGAVQTSTWGYIGGEGMTDPVECHSAMPMRAPGGAAVGRQRGDREISTSGAFGRVCFRVRTSDGRVFELFYGERYDEWRIKPIN